MTQPAAPFLAATMVRALPFSTPQTFISPPTLGAGLSVSKSFEIGSALSDRNAVGSNPTSPPATGFFLDASVFSDQAGTLNVVFSIYPIGAALPIARSVMPGGVPVVVAASTLTLIAGLRIVGLGCLIEYTNTAGVAASVELFAAVRSE